MRKQKREMPEINAGSMADIAFLLLIFWLVATSLKPERGLPDFLETADDKVKIAVPTRASDILIVYVNEDGKYEVDGVEITDIENEFLMHKRSTGHKGKLVVTAHYDAPYKEYMELIRTAEKYKLKTIQKEIEDVEKKE